MATRSHWFIRWVLLLAVLGGAAASSSQQPPINKAPAPKGPTAPQMKMRSMSNAQRRAAAARMAERKLAAGQKNQVVQPTKGAVKK